MFSKKKKKKRKQEYLFGTLFFFPYSIYLFIYIHFYLIFLLFSSLLYFHQRNWWNVKRTTYIRGVKRARWFYDPVMGLSAFAHRELSSSQKCGPRIEYLLIHIYKMYVWDALGLSVQMHAQSLTIYICICRYNEISCIDALLSDGTLNALHFYISIIRSDAMDGIFMRYTIIMIN